MKKVKKNLGVTALDFSQIKLLCLKLGKMQKNTHFWRLIANKILNFLQNFFILSSMLLWSSLSRKTQKKLGFTELDSSEMMRSWPSFSCISPHFLMFSIQFDWNYHDFKISKSNPVTPKFFWLDKIRVIHGNILWSIEKFYRKFAEIWHVLWEYRNTLRGVWGAWPPRRSNDRESNKT